MTDNKKAYLERVLLKKINLLRRGITLPLINGKPFTKFLSPGVGAGPQGKTFYFSLKGEERERYMISLPVLPYDHKLASYAYRTSFGEKPGTLETDDGIVLESRPIPNFLNSHIKNHKLVPANLHCYNTLSMVLSFSCRHYDKGEECLFCEIDKVGKKLLGFPDRQDIAQLVDTVKQAVAEENIRSITITSGTFGSTEEVASEYLTLLKELKKITKLSIHIQIEPLLNDSLMSELSKYADNIGIFLEIFNEDVRKKICPGKSSISREQYIESWKMAVKYFGRGNVVTTCLLGFGVDYDEILGNIEEFAKLGVKTSLMFVRCKSKNLADYTPTYLEKDESEIARLFIEASRILKAENLLFKRNRESGCAGCQGCTAMIDANDLIEESLTLSS